MEHTANMHTPPTVLDIPCDLIDVNPDQPRRHFDTDELAALTTSIVNDGILQPLLLRPHGTGGYQLVAGERRLRAARLAGLTTVPAYVREVDDDALLRLALLENTARVDLNPIEEAQAYQELITRTHITQAELATAVGKSRGWITHALGLLKLPETVQRKAAAGVLTRGHAKALIGLAGDPERVEHLAERVIAEGISVRSLEELVALDDSSAATPPLPRRTATKPHPLTEVSDTLSDWLDTRVTVQAGRSKGRIVVEFSTGEDLDRLLQVLAAPAPQLRSEVTRAAS